MTREIEWDEAVDLLVRAIHEKSPEYVYERPDGPNSGCKYFRRDAAGKPVAPSCIVGHVLTYLGVEDAREGVNADRVIRDSGFTLSPRVATLFSAAQFRQDGGTPWGEAVLVAKKTATEEHGER